MVIILGKEEKIDIIEEEQDFENIGEYLQAIARDMYPRNKYINGEGCGYIDRRLVNWWAPTERDRKKLKKEWHEYIKEIGFFESI